MFVEMPHHLALYDIFHQFAANGLLFAVDVLSPFLIRGVSSQLKSCLALGRHSRSLSGMEQFHECTVKPV